jgi:hypothetical protein
MKASFRLMIAVGVLLLLPVIAACTQMDDISDNGPGETTPVTPTIDDAEDADDAEAPTPESTPEPTPTLEPTPAPEPTPVPEDDDAADDADTEQVSDAELILENAAERAESLESVRFELQSSGVVQIEGVGDVSLREVTGAIDLPDLAEVEIAVQVSGMAVPLSVLSIEGEVYYTDPVTGEWESAPSEFEFDPADIFSSDYGVPALLNSVSEVELIGESEVDGRGAYHLMALIDRETVQNVTNGMVEAEGDVDFEIWVDQETYDILWIEMIDPTGESESAWMIRIFDHNEPVEIEDPREN